MTDSKRIALVTGASAGLGSHFSRLLAQRGYDLILVARRADRLETLAADLSREFSVQCHVIAIDLADPRSAESLLAEVAARGLHVDFLVNNAGFGGSGRFSETEWQDISRELQVMVTTLTELAHRLVPGMRTRGFGRIINVSSLAAFMPPGESMLYTAIKSYVLNMSQALDMELKPYGIHVTALCPGFTYTEFHDVMQTRDQANRLPKILWQQPEEVCRAGIEAVEKGQPICIPGVVNKLLANSIGPVPQGLRYYLGKGMNPFKH